MNTWISRLTGDAPSPPGARPVAGGWLVPANRAALAPSDRGFMLGDGLFETARVTRGHLPLLDRHLARLQAGAAALGFPPLRWEIPAAANALLRQSGATRSGALRITLSRGVGPRGYEVSPVAEPLLVLQFSAWTPPAGIPAWRALLAPEPILPHPLLCRVKSTSALSHVLARTAAKQAGCQEWLYWNTAGHLIEGAATNIFWVRQGRLCTPDLSCGCLPGVARQWVLEQAPAADLQTDPGCFRPDELAHATEAFMTNALLGPVPLQTVQRATDHTALASWPTPGPATRYLMQRWAEFLEAA